MSDTWDRLLTGHPEAPKEFLISVELYISNTAGAALRKPLIRKPKRDSAATAVNEDNRLREKSSWLSLNRGLNGIGQWRSATCKLSEEGERCFLNIYVDESILYQTIYVHLLNQTDIRQADSSLFFRKDCIGVYCITGQRWSSSHSTEPIYLQFFNSDSCSLWLALLKSYAIPEIYGRWFFPMDGGSYRMWRQINMSVVQGRNLGVAGTDHGSNMELGMEAEATDVDISCELHLNDILCGRTTVKKGTGLIDWHESFTFTDLPPFESFDIFIWREKRVSKPAILGSVRITLNNFRRGDPIEGWFPVIQGGSITNDTQVGELRLKIRVDEEVILPHSVYSGLLTTFNSRNFLDWMADFENKLKLKSISTQLMCVAVAKEVIIEQVQEFTLHEVNGGTSAPHQTLFRGNTILTKVMELCMSWYGKPFLEASIGNVLRRLCVEKVAIEVDPMRSGGKSAKDVERGVDQLIYWCQEFWNQIYSVRRECPNELRRLFETIRMLVEQRYRPESSSAEHTWDLPKQSVSAFCFLRFIVPAILHPHLFGLCPGLPSVPVQRSLTLIAKVIQSLANLNISAQKEVYMRGVKDFLRDSLPAMVDYLIVVSTPISDPYSFNPEEAVNRHNRLNVVNSLRQRAKIMSILDREAISVTPHLLDVPRQLAIITSAVIRNSKQFHAQSTHNGDPILEEFRAKCLEVEEQALLRVSQLATSISADSTQQTKVHNYPSSPTSPSEKMPSSPILTSSGRRDQRKMTRPSTAPPPSGSSDSRHGFSPDSSVNLTPLTFTNSPFESRQPRVSQSPQVVHMKAPLTDSVLSLGANDDTRQYPAEGLGDLSDDLGKPKRGLLKGVFRR